MLLLVVANRDMGAAVDENVGGHQARIGVETERGLLAVLAGLVLELRHAVHPTEARDAIEDPGELGMLRHGRLIENDMLFRIDAGRDEGGCDRTDLVRHVLMDELGRQRMHVDDAVDAVIAFLQRHELADRAEIVAEMEIAGRLDAGENDFLEFAHVCPRLGWWRAPGPVAHVANGRAYARGQTAAIKGSGCGVLDQVEGVAVRIRKHGDGAVNLVPRLLEKVHAAWPASTHGRGQNRRSSERSRRARRSGCRSPPSAGRWRPARAERPRRPRPSA